MEGYFVRRLGALPPVCRLVEKVHYPPNNIPGVIVSEIGLWETANDVGSVFSWSYWRGFFTTVPDSVYSVILHQIGYSGQCGDEPLCSHFWTLHVTTDLETSRSSFKALKNTIEPLVDDCTLMLTSGLLKEIVLPEPIDPDQLSHHLTEVMETTPGAHPDWVKVMRALMLTAIGQDDVNSVDALFDKVDILEPDEKGNTFVDQAVSRNKGSPTSANAWKRVASKIIKQNRRVLFDTETNKDGNNPIQLAFKNNLPHLVEAIMSQSGMKLSEIRNKEGSCPLHLAAEAGCDESISAAVTNKCRRLCLLRQSDTPEQQSVIDALNAVNNKGFTPLMLAVQKGYVGSAVSLIQAGANIDVQHSETGNTSLHYAAKLGLIDLVKTLIAFRADLTIKNKSRKIALEEARESEFEDAEECVQLLEETTHLMEAAQAQLSETVEPPPLDPDSTVLLSLDGGGNRGLLTAQILIFIHERMKQLKPNCDSLPRYFDYISGTSLGGLLTLTMVHADSSPQAAISLFFKAAAELFSKTPNCPKDIVDTSMIQTFGPTGFMADVKVPRVMVTTCKADQNPPELELLCNYRQTSEKKWKTWEVARATTAAPTYFPPVEEKYVDGGFVANNPTLDAMVEILDQGEREGKSPKFGMVLSLGTGCAPYEEVSDIEFFYPDPAHVVTSIRRLRETVRGISNLFNLLLSQSTRSDGQEVERARQWCKMIDSQFFRFSPPLSKTVTLAVKEKVELVELMYIGLHYSLRNAKELDTVARLLLSRQPRAQAALKH